MKTVIGALLVSLLAACGGGKEEEAKGVIPEHMIESMDKAENVEDVLRQADQQRREQGDNQ